MLGKIKSTLVSAATAMFGVAGAFALAIILVLAWRFAVPLKYAGDSIAENSAGSFSGRVVGFEFGVVDIVLHVETPVGFRSVTLLEVGLLPFDSSPGVEWRDRSIFLIRKYVSGKIVKVYYPKGFTAASTSVMGHVVYDGNTWLNGEMVKGGYCYAMKPVNPDYRLAGKAVREFERDLQVNLSGCWEVIPPQVFKTLPNHY